MRILLLNYEYPPLGGGAGNATQYLLSELAKEPEIAVDLVTSSVDRARLERPSERQTLHFLDIHRKGGLHYQSNKDLLSYSWQAWRYARGLTRRHEYDVCHAFFGIPCGFIAMHLALPYIVSLRGSDVPFYNERFRNLDRLLFQRLSRRIWRKAGRVVANSEGLRSLALESAPSQAIDVICNGVDTEAFHPSPRTGHGLRAICVSRLIARKGLQYLIRSLSQLRDLDVALTLVGTGNQQAELEAVARECDVTERVHFVGAVEHKEIAAAYQAHDVFVLPSLIEGMSNTALEAMACGLPLLMTDTGGAAELVEDGKNGFLIRERDADDIARRLRWYAENKDMARRHGERSRERAERMSWSSVAKSYVSMYRSVAR